MVKILDKLIDKKRHKKIKKILNQVNSFAEEMASLSDEKLQDKTSYFKNRLSKGDSLDDILPEAFAVVREVDKRILGMYPFDVQVLGAIVLHQGNIAEMKTGEGKTLTATMPAYLNALTSKGVIVITPSSYLAQRDFEEMKPVFEFLGLSVALGFSSNDEEFTAKDKRKAYGADILYTTNGALGFDYLFDNLSGSQEDKYFPKLNYAIIDEVDSVLLDSAQTPLIISSAPRVQSNYYKVSDNFVSLIKEDIDYKYDDKKSELYLTPKGVKEAEKYFDFGHLFLDEHKEAVKHINLALRSRLIYKKNKDYVVENNEVKLLDFSTGRVLEGTKLQSGQHQAIEAKEKVDISPNNRAVASITYQNLFKMFNKISGMSGTAKVAEKEFIDTYNMAVLVIPTNNPVIRKDYDDKIYCTFPEKLTASLNLIKEIHKTKRPLLIVTGTVSIADIYSKVLLNEGIAHSVLTARNTAKEAEIIKEAGTLGAVTVATTIAGRGTDIKLGKGVRELGGLAVIGTERFASKRIDLQARGRAGRQGDPGSSQFFISLEDDLLTKWGSDKVKTYFDKYLTEVNLTAPKEIVEKKLIKMVDVAQDASDSSGAGSRKTSTELDESMSIQRKIIYQQRNQLINGDVIKKESIINIIKAALDIYFEDNGRLDSTELMRYILDNVTYRFSGNIHNINTISQAKAFILDIIKKEIDYKTAIIGEENMSKFYRAAILNAIDLCWIEQVDTLQQLKGAVLNRGSGQSNPIYEYHNEAHEYFEIMKRNIKGRILKNISLSSIEINKNGEADIYFA